MTFLNPLVLLGLIAASIPLILHLLNLRKLKTVEFSTLRFLKELQRSQIRKLKLKQIILLILRTLIIIFAVLAFARPTVKTALPFFGSYAKTSTVIIVDNSFSMEVSDELGNRLNQARNASLSIINGLKEGDDAAILLMTKTDRSDAGLSTNLNLLKDDLKRMKVTTVASNLQNSLRKAESILEKSDNINKEIFIISDAQPNIFLRDISDSLKLFKSGASVFFIPLGLKSNTEIQNLSIDSINVITRIYQKNKNVELEALIHNNSSKSMTGNVVSLFYNDQRVAQRTFDIPSMEYKTLPIAAAPFNYGVIKSYFELENDAIEQDNKRYFGFVVPEKPNVAIIGDLSKTLYISMILDQTKNPDSPANSDIFQPSSIPSIDLNKYDVVICCSGPYTKSDFQRLDSYLKNGGSVLMFADDKTDKTIFYDGLMNYGFGTPKLNEFSSSKPAEFTSVDRMHPIFEGVFKGTTDNKSIVESPKITKSLNIQGGQTIIDMPGGGFLSENRLGDGKILYCAVTPDNSWSTFPLTGLFPTLIYRSVIYLSSKEELGTNVTAGTTLKLSLSKKFSSGGNFRIIDPDNVEFFQQAASLPTGAILTFDYLEKPGVYTVMSPDGKPISVFSVNVDPSESNLSKLSENELESTVKTFLSENANLLIINQTGQILKNIERARIGSELWQLSIILALICIVAEMLVAKNTKAETEGA